MNKVAILKIADKAFTYYEDEDDDIIICRADPGGEMMHNPYWDIDILSEDLPFSEIVYLDQCYADIYIKEKDFHEIWDDLFNSNHIPCDSKTIIERIKRYLNGEK